ncbi:MAG: hypothetical protein M3Y07_09135 [Acidobacteriota bacterium]|nr:hypothetical protein [Acidobacteriota bacterium]
MANERLEILKNLVAQNPKDTFSRYGLAMEYANTGDLPTAVAEYGKLLEDNPKYAAAYFHGGHALEKLDRLEEARAMYERGIAVTTETGDLHTRSEIQAALDLLG